MAILDADKEGFRRNETTLIQTMGRAARHQEGRVILYADKTTLSMKNAIKEVDRRRKIQERYNKEHNIDPETVFKTREEILRSTQFADTRSDKEPEFEKPEFFATMSNEDQLKFMIDAMKTAARNLDFETAIAIRDEVDRLSESANKRKSKRKRR